jgi:hypothetical protein
MSGIKGLKKGERPSIEKEAKNFIKGATERVAGHSPQKNIRPKKYERYTFSLTPEISKDIDNLSLVPMEFKVNRSEVLKAGVELLKSLPDNELVKALRNVKSFI